MRRLARFERGQDQCPAVTGARRKISSPSASERAFSTAAHAAADRRFADAARADRRFRIGNVERVPLACLAGTSRMVGGLLWWKRLASGRSVVLVVDPLLADGVADAEHGAAESSARPRRAGWITVPTSARRGNR